MGCNNSVPDDKTQKMYVPEAKAPSKDPPICPKYNDSGDHYYLVKIVLVGDSGCGKSSLIKRYTEGTFSFDFKSTIGVEFGSKVVPRGEKVLKLQIWDTAGQERFRSITRAYYRGANSAVMVYDVGVRSSFESLKRWIAELAESIDVTDDFCLVVVGNKVDVEGREVTPEEANAFVEELGMKAKYYETSAKENISVTEVFEYIAGFMAERIEKPKTPPVLYGK